MSKDVKIKYEPHPVSPERKAELRAAGYRIIDAVYAPKGAEAAPAAEPNAGKPVGLAVGKGPGGRFYVKRGKEIVTGPYATADEAEAALAKEAAE